MIYRQSVQPALDKGRRTGLGRVHAKAWHAQPLLMAALWLGGAVAHADSYTVGLGAIDTLQTGSTLDLNCNDFNTCLTG